MYASLIAMQVGLEEKYAPKLFAWLRRYDSDQAIGAEARSLLRNVVATWDTAVNGPVAGAVYPIEEVSP
jgi:hypothetical protein